MDKAFLLRAFDRLVCSIEIRYKHAFEALQQLLNDLPLAAFGENVDDLCKARQNPHVGRLSLNVGSGFVGVNETSVNDPIKDLCLGIQVDFGGLDFEIVQ